MILSAHNAHLLKVESGALVPADPVLGQGAITPTVKWQGDCQAYLRDTVLQEVRGSLRSPEAPQQIVQLPATQVTLPSNLPCTVAVGDVLTLQRLSAMDAEQLNTETYQVRKRDESGWSMGAYNYVCIVTNVQP